MPLLGFHARFAPLVETGEKCQTIRAYRKDGRDPKVGDRLHLWTGLRRPGARKLGEATAIRVREVRLSATQGVGLYAWVNAQPLDAYQTNALAQRDGFYDSSEMHDFFEENHGLPFRGLLIEWDLIEAEG